MMTTQETELLESQWLRNILFVLAAQEPMRRCTSGLQITIEDAAVVIRGHVPSADLKSQLIPAVRRAGVLGRVFDCVQVQAT
jgi:hypothetical protein